MGLQLLHSFSLCIHHHNLGFREKGADLVLKPVVLLALLYKWDAFFEQSWARLQPCYKSLICSFSWCGRLELRHSLPLALQRDLTLCCRVTASIFFQVRKENEEEEERKKKPTCWLYWITKPTSCCGGNSFLTLMPPPRLSVFAWSQWLLEPPSPTVRRAKSSPASTTTQSQALEGKAQARKATQTHWWKPVSATYAYRPPYLAGFVISVVDSLPVLQA